MIGCVAMAAALLAGEPPTVAAPPVLATEAPAGTLDPCAGPPDDRPPDPRCGEPLDGRPPTPPPATSAAQAVLTVPRLASRALFWPVVNAGEVLESHHVASWMDAILTTDDGRVGVRPELRYASGFLPTV